MTDDYPTWSWQFENVDGQPVYPDGTQGQTFPSQADAETWVGEAWRDLLAAGVEQVNLLEGERTVYGPMSLRPVR